MDKGIGFNRNIKLAWLEATAAFCLEMDDGVAVRRRLEAIVGQEIESATNIRKTIDILLNIWGRPQDEGRLQQQGLKFFRESEPAPDRLWLHYGMTMLRYPFFCQAVSVMGQFSRYEEVIRARAVRERLFAELGELGSIREAAGRVIYSLRDWGILRDGKERGTYVPQYRTLAAKQAGLEQWLLACALATQPAAELAFADLLHLPGLFPFKFTVTAHDLRQAAGFEVQRQGMGLDMVRVGCGR